MENSRGISRASLPNALPKTLRNFLARISRTCTSPNFLFSPAAHAKNVFEERYWLLIRDALRSACCIAGHEFDRFHRYQSIRVCRIRLSHASQNFPFGHTHEILPPQNRDRYFHRVDAFPASTELTACTIFPFFPFLFPPEPRQRRRFHEIAIHQSIFFRI